MTVGEVIRMCRWEKGLSARKLSEKSGVAKQTIYDAEYGRRSTSVSVLIELLDIMGYELVVTKKINGEQTQKYRVAEAVIGKGL